MTNQHAAAQRSWWKRILIGVWHSHSAGGVFLCLPTSCFGASWM